ncbi:unnamed protein product [Dracunculus medinensis]|uniref:BPI1 domain-containing protein n=1 Tax=Dracunculus medinensis TaxID=318479 RepID=A0A0N4ULT8_DRAME|nr:unnamed protein product [Dracunculus medinensis]
MILELPGVKIRLTKWGAEEVKNVGVKVLGEEISQLKGFRFLHSFAERGIVGRVLLYDVMVLHYSPPQFDSLNFYPPSYVILQLERMDIALFFLFFRTLYRDYRLTGRFVSDVGLITTSGSVVGEIRQMSVKLTTDFKAAPDGLMQVKVNAEHIVVECANNIAYSHFSINVDGPLSGLIRMIEVNF